MLRRRAARAIATAALTVGLVASAIPVNVLGSSSLAIPVQLSPIALGATLPPFLQTCCLMSGAIGFRDEQDFEVPTARTPGKPTLIVIALRDDFHPGQSITRVVDSRSGAPYSLVAGTPLANGLMAAAYAKIATAADGGSAIISLSTRLSRDQPARVWEFAFVAQRASGFDDHSSTSVESPGDTFVTQPSFTPSVDNELVVSIAAFTAPVTGTTVDPAKGDPFFFHNGDVGQTFGPNPAMTVSFAYGTAGQPTGVRRLRAFGGPVTQDAVLVFGVLPQEFDLSQELIEAGFGEDGIVGIPVAEPVNALTGNLTLTSVDLSLPGRGPSLRLSRTFNGRDTRVGTFGRGWTSSLEWRVADAGATATITRGDGRRDVYRRQADGTYLPPNGVFDVLSRSATGWRFLTPEQLVIEFSPAGVVQRMTDRNGNALTLTADASARVTKVADDAGRSIDLTYSADGALAGAADSTGRSVSYGYSAGRLVGVTDPTGATTQYAYDSAGHLVTVTDPLGNAVMTNTYDSRGRVTAQRDAVGGMTTFAYDPAAPTTTITSPRLSTTRVVHDASGHVVSLVDALGAAVSYGYDARGNQTSLRDRNGNLWQFAYDANGNRIRITDPSGASSTFAFDARNNLITRADPLGSTWRYTYDARGNLATVTDPEGGVTTVETDAFGQLTRVTDADGVAVAYAYDTAGEVISVTTPAGTARMSYDAPGRPVATTDPNGNRTSFAYDAVGRLTSSTDALGVASTFAYDAAGNLVRSIDRRGTATQFGYDNAGQLIRVTDGLGGVTLFTYDANGNRTAAVDPAGKRLNFTYDARDRLATVSDPEGGVARFTYDANGNIVASTDPRGNVARATYNFRDQRETATDRTGAVTQFAYDAAARLVSTTDPLGATTAFAYDRAGRFVATTDALGAITRIAYSAAGRRTALNDPKGNVTRFAHDPAGRLASLTDALGGVVVYAYDANGNRVAQTDQLGRTTRYAYDALDRVARVTDARGGVTSLAYDSAGALVSLVDAKGGTTAYRYDALARLVGVTDSLGGVTSYSYDARGLLTGLTDANGHTRAYAYDGNRRLVRETDGLGRVRGYTYDASGNAASILDAKGQTTAFGYDAEDRLTSIRYADATSVQFTRNAVGDRLSMVDPTGTTTYTYDLLRRLTRTTDALGKTVSYGYDANGLRTSLTYPDGTTATYAFDALDRLVSVNDGIGGTNTYAYDAVGNRLSATFANGSKTRAAYDVLDRLISIANLDARGKSASRFTYSYDALGNITGEHRGKGDDGEDDADADGPVFAYDPLSRLVTVADEDRVQFFSYDAVGNRVSVSGEDGEVRATFDAADQLTALVRDDGEALATLTYDANGNLVAQSAKKGSRTFSYDAADRLVGVADAERSTTYRYDGDGTLVGETSTEAKDHGKRREGPTALTYTIDRAAALSQILSATDGSAVTRYLYGNERIAAQGAVTRYYGADVRGSVRSTTDEQGQRVDTFRYDAWGIPRGREATDRHEDADLAGLFGFTGERQDSVSGLVYLRARWYAPSSGRFLTPDLDRGDTSDPRTLQRYAYALDDPTTLVDPTGLSAARLFDLRLRPPRRTSGLTNSLLFVGGIGLGAVNTVFGLVGVANAIANSTLACGARFIERHARACDAQWAANTAVASSISSDWGRFARQTAAAAVANCRDAIVDDSWLSAGECTFDLANAVVGAKGLAGAVAPARAASVWSRAPVARGAAIERALGGNLPRSFPVIDRFEAGIATSIKSIDLAAPTYQSTTALASRLTDYVDRVASFNGATFAEAIIRPEAISGRALVIAVEPGVASVAQEEVLRSIILYGAQRGVSVTVVPIR